ncbi:TPA: phage tail length tape measure family protein [Klebsiella oxytoca]|nr:phage tail length tape measure family protein [Klebsiella oxytoca]HDY4040031.1 phage tail length tape measure family protein [Klebsiella oxytoca]
MAEQESRLAIRLDSSGAEKQADSLAVALLKMTRAGEEAERATDELGDATQNLNSRLRDGATATGRATKFTEEQREAFRKLRGQIDPVGAAIDRIGKKYTELKGYFDRGQIDLDEYRTLAKNLDAATNELTGVAKAEREAAKAADEQKAALQRLAEQLDPISDGFRKIADNQKLLDNAKAKGMLSAEQYDSLSGKLKQMRGELELTQAQLGKTGMSARQTAFAMRMIPAQMTDIVVGLSTGQSPFMVLMQQGGQLKDMFGGIGPAIKGVGGYVAGLINPFTVATAVIGALGVAYFKAQTEQENFNKALILTGNYAGLTTSKMNEMAKSMEGRGITQNAAAKALAEVAGTGKFTAKQIEIVTGSVLALDASIGQTADKTISNFKKIYENPTKSSKELNEELHYLTASQYSYISSLERKGEKEAAAEAAANAYLSAMKQRSDAVIANLGLIERAIKSATNRWGEFWNAALNVGRPMTEQYQLDQVNKAINQIYADRKESGKGDLFEAGLKNLLGQKRGLEYVIKSQQGYADAQAKSNEINEKGIEAQDVLNKYLASGTSAAEKRTLAQKELNKAIADNAAAAKVGKARLWTSEDIAKARVGIEKQFKDPKTPKTPKGRVYTEDAAARLLDQINQQTAAVQSQLDASDKLNSATQARVKFEQQIADLKSKVQLTADQKSLLARSEAILQAYKQQEALQNSVKTLDDYRKMQEQIAPKELRQNEALQKRLEILQKMVELKKLSPEDAGKQATDLISKSILPDSIIAGVNKAGGTLTSSATNTDLAGQGLNMIGLQIDPQLEIIEKLKLAQTDYAAWLNQQQQAITQSTVLNEQQKQQQLLALQQQGQQNQEALSTAVYVAQMQSAQNSFSGITDSMGTMFGEQSAMYKAAFVTQKAFAIAQAALQLPMAMGQAMAGLPFPANLAAVAQVIGLMASITSSISSAALTGMAHNGIDSVPSTGTWLLEKGERVMTADTSARLDSTLENLRKNGLDATLSKPGFGTGVQNVNSDNSRKTTIHAPIEQHFHSPAGVTPDQMAISMAQTQKRATTEAINQVAAQVIKGDGKVGNAMRSKYPGRGMS